MRLLTGLQESNAVEFDLQVGTSGPWRGELFDSSTLHTRPGMQHKREVPPVVLRQTESDVRPALVLSHAECGLISWSATHRVVDR